MIDVPDVQLLEEDEVDGAEVVAVDDGSGCSSTSCNSTVRSFKLMSSSLTLSTSVPVMLPVIFDTVPTMQLSSENSECVQSVVVLSSDSPRTLDRRSLVSSCRSSREDMIGPMSFVSSSIQPSMTGKTLLRCISMSALLKLASVPVGAIVVVGINKIADETSPRLMIGSKVGIPLIFVVTLATLGGLTKMVAEDEATVPVPRGTESEPCALMPVLRMTGGDTDGEGPVDELDILDLSAVGAVASGIFADEECASERVGAGPAVVFVYGPLLVSKGRLSLLKIELLRPERTKVVMSGQPSKTLCVCNTGDRWKEYSVNHQQT